MRSLLLALLLTGCAVTPLRSGRRMGLTVDGPRTAETLYVVGLDVVLHDDAPLTGAARAPIVLPEVPSIEASAVRDVVLPALVATAEARGLSVLASTTEPWSGDLPRDLPQRLEDVPQARDIGGMTLRVHLGWCLVQGQPVACVRSPDTALGYGPPALDGRVYARLKTASDGVFARRVTVVDKSYVYTIDDGAHTDRPFVGTGSSAQEQAEDAVRQAVAAWMVRYAGRRGQRALSR